MSKEPIKEHGQTDAKNLASTGHGSTTENKTAAAPEPKQSSDPGADADAARVRQAEQDAAARNRGVDPAARRTPMTETDKELEALRRPVGDQPQPVTINDPASKEGMIAQHHRVDEENARRNEANAEGNEKNLDRAREDAARGHAEYERAPPTGKQRDENTPDVRPDGSKVWK